MNATLSGIAIKIPDPGPLALASACKILGMKGESNGELLFHAERPDGADAVVCLRLLVAPRSVTVDGQALADVARIWEPETKLLR
jgi:hypothetical protein